MILKFYGVQILEGTFLGWTFRIMTGLKVGQMTRRGLSGSLFGGSSGSHPQTKLSGCDPDF